MAHRVLNRLRATGRLGWWSGNRHQVKTSNKSNSISFSRVRSERTGAWAHACIRCLNIHYREPIARKL